ncbi:LytTR family transcriptional regulator [Rhodobacteraceae bacterium (ex Bugula neritina AB1)]|nr:LytTR family transcriptional regulator [Rhodobacteraceae bacterium (ex Bugula neritina AB1)]
MTMIAGIGFTAPWLLLGLLGLPLLWLLLRAIPPAPKRQAFPAVTLLLGLKDDESLSDRTPWWLLLLRFAAVAAAIIGLSGPVLNPAAEDGGGSGPVLIVMDASWGGAAGWKQTIAQARAQLEEAGRAERPAALLQLTAPEPLQFRAASGWQRQLAGLAPLPWQPGPEQLAQALEAINGVEGGFDTVWFSDGLDYADHGELIEALSRRGDIEVFEQPLPVLGLLPASYTGSAIALTAQRSRAGAAQEISVVAQGKDPGGTERSLASLPLRFADGVRTATAELSLPAELRARLSRFEIRGANSAGAVALTDDSLRRREVALVSSQSADEGLALLSPMHYLRQALAPSAELLEGALADLLPANPDVIVLADVARLAPAQEEAVIEWVENGGLLLRFAGPRLAASDTARAGEEPLMPVRLRIGGRSIGGAMSWGEPKTLAPFGETSPFFGLESPGEVSVRSQVVAQPDPELADRVIAELADGTPLVTRKTLGQGQVVLFHVTANAEWSNLPLSGLFVSMLERLAVSSSAAAPKAEDLEGTTWTPLQVLDGFGRMEAAETLPGVAGPDLVAAPAGPQLRPGIYDSGRRMLARNVLRQGDELSAARWPASVAVSGYGAPQALPLGGVLLALALGLLALDVLGTLAVSGLLARARTAALAAAIGLSGLALPQDVQAQPLQPVEDSALDYLTAAGLASELVLAHVLTGDAQVDKVAAAGLRGLTDTLFLRTSVEPAAPVSIDLERDELAFFPLLYWPITRDQPLPSSEAYAKLNTYLRAGGMILFDTRDADLTASGATSPAARRLQQIALPLDIPPLEVVPADHVLTRAFYLLQAFPGRHGRGPVWVEAAPPDAEQAEGIPFRNLNDGVTPVVIGGNDWAAAWAVDSNGRPLLPVGRGYAGERQRELAYRFGVNLVMHVLTGNYKSDQVHVPALLDRLGQ